MKAKGDQVLSSDEQLETMEDVPVRVVPVIRRVMDPNTRQPADNLIGYELERTLENGTKVYCGKTVSWGPRGSAIEFKTRAEAEEAARVWMETEGARAVPVRLPVIRHRVDLYMAVGCKEPDKPQVQFNIRLTGEETQKMESLLRGLRTENVELATNEPVDSYPDVLRWLLRQMPLC